MQREEAFCAAYRATKAELGAPCRLAVSPEAGLLELCLVEVQRQQRDFTETHVNEHQGDASMQARTRHAINDVIEGVVRKACRAAWKGHMAELVLMRTHTEGLLPGGAAASEAYRLLRADVESSVAREVRQHFKSRSLLSAQAFLRQIEPKVCDAAMLLLPRLQAVQSLLAEVAIGQSRVPVQQSLALVQEVLLKELRAIRALVLSDRERDGSVGAALSNELVPALLSAQEVLVKSLDGAIVERAARVGLSALNDIEQGLRDRMAAGSGTADLVASVEELLSRRFSEGVEQLAGLVALRQESAVAGLCSGAVAGVVVSGMRAAMVAASEAGIRAFFAALQTELNAIVARGGSDAHAAGVAPWSGDRAWLPAHKASLFGSLVPASTAQQAVLAASSAACDAALASLGEQSLRWWAAAIVEAGADACCASEACADTIAAASSDVSEGAVPPAELFDLLSGEWVARDVVRGEAEAVLQPAVLKWGEGLQASLRARLALAQRSVASVSAENWASACAPAAAAATPI